MTDVTVGVDEHIATVTLDRPPVNAATNASGQIAPGSYVSLYGSGLAAIGPGTTLGQLAWR